MILPLDAPHDALRAALAAMMLDIARRPPEEAESVTDGTPCVGGPLLTDSLDVLEFVVALDREFGVSIRDGDRGREALRDMGTLTRFVGENRTR